MKRILIIKLQAIGDVAMATQLLYGVATANPEVSFTLLTQPYLTGLLFNPPQNMEGMALDVTREEKYYWGTLKYAHRLRKENFDIVIDLQRSWRSKILRTYLRFFRTKPFKIRLPKKGRRKMTARPRKKKFTDIPSMLEVYSETVKRAGLRLPKQLPYLNVSRDVVMALQQIFPSYDKFTHMPWVGVAPFSLDPNKTYDLKLMETFVRNLSATRRCVILLFGAQGKQAGHLHEWAKKYPDVLNISGTLSLAEELAVIKQLKLMVSMDSANPHLSALVGTRTLTLWSASHPKGGFAAYNQLPEDHLQAEMDCRPCTIDRKKKCYKGDSPCCSLITPEEILKRVLLVLDQIKTISNN